MKLIIRRQIIGSCITVLILSGCLNACKKYVDAGTPTTALTPDKVYEDSTATLGAVLALYSNNNMVGATSSTTSGAGLVNLSQYGAMSSDEGYYFNNATYDPYRTNTLSSGNQGNVVSTSFFQNIYYANSNIENITSSTAYGNAFKDQLIGECKFWRAYCFFNLVNYFGPVPLTITSDVAANAKMASSSVDKVYAQIEADLVDAKSKVSANYPSPERARINKAVVSALLSRVYLYLKKWPEAEAEATSIIGNTSTYFLEPDLNNVFVKTSNEVIWQVVSPVSAGITGVTKMGNFYIPSGTTPLFVLYDTLATTFEPGDLRKTNWTKPLIYSGTTYYYPFKYKIRNVSVPGNEYYVLLRLAEQYLIRSEARAQQGNLSGLNSAETDLNTVRIRAGLSPVSLPDKNAALKALEHERWVELFTENSDRWFNLKRTARIDDVLKLTKPQWKSFQALYPIPLADRTANPNLKDNPLY